jgi:Phosphotransferase enzyme family
MNTSNGSDPDANRARKIASEVAASPSRFGLTKVVSVEVVTGGVAHHVFRINTQEGRFYLKYRGNHFPKITGICIKSTDIAHEHRALSLLSDLIPECFPRVLFFDAERSFMILTDAMPGKGDDSGTLESLLLAHRVDLDTLRRWGRALGKIHGATSSISEPIRAGGDDQFFAKKLQDRFGFKNNPALKAVIRELSGGLPRQIIIGDPSPKNIGVSQVGNKLVFFDLEDVHLGCAVFDAGFCLGHLILHAHREPEYAVASVQAFADGYAAGGLTDSGLAKAIALGTICYRLDGCIPYPVAITPEEKSRLLKGVEAALTSVQTRAVSWDELIDRLSPRR